jgi:nitrate/nitrite transport system permease protein
MVANAPGAPGWRASLTRRGTWRRGLTLGLPVGFLQVTVNQGDIWLRGAADVVVVMKSIASPLIAVGIAVASAAWAEAKRSSEPARLTTGGPTSSEHQRKDMRRVYRGLGILLLPLVGIGLVLLAWQALASSGLAKDLPSPAKTWQASKLYILEPLEKRGEMDQGILRFTWYSLVLVAKGYALGLLIGTPLGLLLGVSSTFYKALDPVIQILRPVSPLAWLPLGLVLFQKSAPAAVFTIAICSMWPTVLNTALGVRSIPQDYLNVARVLRLSPWRTLTKVLIPATLPYMFTGFRLSLGIAWLVIVAAEMLTGTPGVGGFLWQEYNSLIYEHIILCILTIGVVGFTLDRVMSLIERRFKTA